MMIAIIGAGNVGGTLGRRWVDSASNTIVFGVRDPAEPKVRELVASIGASASAATVADSVRDAEVVVLATPYHAAQSALANAGSLAGKTLLDCTNPLRSDLAGLEIGQTTSAGEQVAGWAPGAHVVKVFNTTGFNNMANPDYGGVPATMFYAGDDAKAKAVAHELAAQIGFDPVDAGPLVNARMLEPLAALWVYLAVHGNIGREFAFKLLLR